MVHSSSALALVLDLGSEILGWATALGASDASTDFGFGVCASTVTEPVAQRIGRLAEKGDCFMRLQRDGDDVCEERDVLRDHL